MTRLKQESAKIIRLIDVLIPKITPSTSKCQNNTDDVLESMNNLSALLNELSSKSDLSFSPQKKQSLKSSAKIVSKVTNFLIQKSQFKFEHFCTKDKEHNTDFITAVSKMMGDLADLNTDLDGETAANEVRKQENFTKKVVVKLANMTFLFFLISLSFRPPSTNLEISILLILTATPLALLTWLLTLWMILLES